MRTQKAFKHRIKLLFYSAAQVFTANNEMKFIMEKKDYRTSVMRA